MKKNKGRDMTKDASKDMKKTLKKIPKISIVRIIFLRRLLVDTFEVIKADFKHVPEHS